MMNRCSTTSGIRLQAMQKDLTQQVTTPEMMTLWTACCRAGSAPERCQRCSASEWWLRKRTKWFP